MHPSLRPTRLLPLVLSLLCATSAHATLLGVTWTGDVLLIDPLTGSSSPIGPSGYADLNALAMSPDGTIYAAGRGDDLLVIDPLTGVATSIAQIALAGETSTEIRGLAYTAQGTLIAVQDGGIDYSDPEYPNLDDRLFEIDLGTGVGSLIGSVGATTLQALAFSPDATLYGWSGSSVDDPLAPGLMIIDPSDATSLGVAPDGTSVPVLQSLVFTPDGQLYGAWNGLYTIDPQDGSYAFVPGSE